MKTMYRVLKNNKGQSAVEFIIVSVVFFFFLFFLLSVSILFVVSDYVEYATFMAARTYRSGAFSESRQRQSASDVFNAYVSKVEGIAKNFNIQFSQAQSRFQMTSGVRVTYTMPLFYMPPIFAGNVGPSTTTLTTESYLGRDPSVTECQNFFTQFISSLGLNINTGYANLMDDSGC